MFAQTDATHWTMNSSGCAGTNCYVNCCLYINGELQAKPDWEIGVFDQDEICRGAKLPQYVARYDWYYYGITCKGYEGCEYHFRIWDHETDSEVTNLTLDIEEEIIYVSMKKYGKATEPYHLNFAMEGGTVYERTIDGYVNPEANDGYVLIASPIGAVPVASVGGLVAEPAEDYDLYSFDQSETLEWRNYKSGSFDALQPGIGYLYASKETTTLSFDPAMGAPVTDTEVEVPVSYDDDAMCSGWNLLGNPFAVDATIGDDKPYYVMNTDGNGYTAMDGGTPIPAMVGIFYVSTAAEENVVFTPASGAGKGASFALNLTQGRGVIDRAIVSYKGRELPKIRFRENGTSVYVPRDNRDYAVVRGESCGEMPVNFKAAENGTYTLTLSSENVEFGYLHLVDNMTGADVDLLKTPSYSFEATTSDYASRFRLVFATGEATDGNFAFVSDGTIILSGVDGSSVVSVYDVTGRLVGSHTGVSRIATDGMSAGVYMVQLVNGGEAMTQKIVVK